MCEDPWNYLGCAIHCAHLKRFLQSKPIFEQSPVATKQPVTVVWKRLRRTSSWRFYEQNCAKLKNNGIFWKAGICLTPTPCLLFTNCGHSGETSFVDCRWKFLTKKCLNKLFDAPPQSNSVSLYHIYARCATVFIKSASLCPGVMVEKQEKKS